MRCDVRCLNAEHHRCVCRCGGRNHGYLRRAKNTRLDGFQEYIYLNHVQPIRRLFEGVACVGCGHILNDADVMGYPHTGGLHVEDYGMRLWVFAQCAKCGYQNAPLGSEKSEKTA